jgi:hypothetical protein
LNLRDIIRNYGGMICIVVLIIHIICFSIFCFTGIKPIENKLEDLFILGKAITRRRSGWAGFLGVNDSPGMEILNNQIDQRKKFNLWGQIKLLKLRKQKNIPSIKLKLSNPPKKPKKLSSNENPKESEEINIRIMDLNEGGSDILQNNQNQIKINPIRQKTDVNNSEKNDDVKIYNQKDNTKEDKKSDNSRLYDYENDELNELPFDKAMKNDHRNFCQYYGNILLIGHIILNVFFRRNDFNLFTIKLCLLFMTFAINLTFNIFFFTNKSMKLNYIKSVDDVSIIFDNFVKSLYSSILANILLIFLKYICLTHNSVRSLRQIKDVNSAEKQSVCILRCIKLRILIYYILSLIFLIIFGFYILSFCAIFENTQIELIKSTFYSWLISLIYPFIICFITSIIRSISFILKSKCLYAVKLILQFF